MIDPDTLSRATRAMCAVLYGDDFDLHDEGSQDPDFRASLELAAEAAITAGLTREWRAKGFLPADEQTARRAAGTGGGVLQSRWVSAWAAEARS